MLDYCDQSLVYIGTKREEECMKKYKYLPTIILPLSLGKAS